MLSVRSTPFLFAAAGLALGLASVAQAQLTYNQLVGINNNEHAQFITPTTDGGFAVTGFTQPVTGADRDILVNKHRADGTLDWSVRFGGANQDVGYCIQQTSDGGYIIGAETSSVGAVFNLALLRLDPAGNYMWSFAYDGDLSSEDSVYGPERTPGVSVRQTSEGGFVLTGRKRASPNLQDQGGVVVRTLPNGVQVFNRRYGDARFTERARLSFTDIRQLPDGTLIVSGTEELPTTAAEAHDPIIARLDPAGNPIFFRNYALPGNINVTEHGTGDGIDFLAGGAFVITGHTDRGTNASDLHALRTDAAGNPNWYRVVERVQPAFRAINEDQFNLISIGGRTSAAAGAGDAMFLRLTPAGGFSLGWRYGHLDGATSLTPSPISGGYALVGSLVPPTGLGFGGIDIEMIKTDNGGSVGCLDDRFEAQPQSPEITPPLFEPTLSFAQEFLPWQGQYVRWQQTVDIICPRPCDAADFNGDGNLDPDDLSDFITCFFLEVATPGTCPAADFNNDGFVDPDDLADYITLFFTC